MAIFAVAIEDSKERNIFKFSELGKHDTAVLVILFRLIWIVPSLRSPLRGRGQYQKNSKEEKESGIPGISEGHGFCAEGSRITHIALFEDLNLPI